VLHRVSEQTKQRPATTDKGAKMNEERAVNKIITNVDDMSPCNWAYIEPGYEKLDVTDYSLMEVMNNHMNNSQMKKTEIDYLYKEITESDPNGIDAHAPGAKLDSGKVMAGVIGDFASALMEVAKVGTFGANKYSRGGWQHVENGVVRYYDAMWRHILDEKIYGPIDADSKCLHAAQIAWNALATLELRLREAKK
jgi:hypothetical protein